MSKSSNTNEDKKKSKYNNRIAALAKYTAPNDPIPINGTTMPSSELSALYRAGLDTRTVLDDERQQAKVALTNRQAADAACRKVEKGIKAWVLSKFGDGSQAAIAFGVAPKTPTQPKTEVKAKAAEQAQATKKARGIIGSKKRKAIKAPAATAATTAATTK
jgi:hypothetical protein